MFRSDQEAAAAANEAYRTPSKNGEDLTDQIHGLKVCLEDLNAPYMRQLDLLDACWPDDRDACLEHAQKLMTIIYDGRAGEALLKELEGLQEEGG